ncbi:MAG TPA: hypothetical protein VML55_14635 [Planctomycetaceae bacterium]|nr:hypothetical protein [Planctomycetaceae bacterium]
MRTKQQSRRSAAGGLAADAAEGAVNTRTKTRADTLPRRSVAPGDMLPEYAGLLTGRRQTSLAATLGRCGIEMHDGWRGTLKTRGLAAEVSIEADGAVRIAADLPAEDSAADGAARVRWLERNAALPGNVRFARWAGRWQVVADTQIDGAVHLEATIGQIRAGLREACSGSSQRAPGAAGGDRPTADEVQAAIDGLGWEREQTVRQDDSWELRPRFGDATLAVSVTLTDELRLSRTLIEHAPAELCRTAMSDQALRFNGQLRLVRLSAENGRIVAESRLHRGLVRPGWLADAVRAVAVAARHVRPVLDVLATDETAARWYVGELTNDEANDERMTKLK